MYRKDPLPIIACLPENGQNIALLLFSRLVKAGSLDLSRAFCNAMNGHDDGSMLVNFCITTGLSTVDFHPSICFYNILHIINFKKMAMIKHMSISLKGTFVKSQTSQTLGTAVYPVFQSFYVSSSRSAGAAGAAGFKQPPSLTFNPPHSRGIPAPISGLVNCRYFAVSSPNVKNAAKPLSRISTSQAYIASVFFDVVFCFN